MIYNKSIIIYKKSEMIVNDGVPGYNWNQVATVKADVQPITQAKVKRTFGELENVQYRVFINKVIDLNTSDYKVVYKGNEYIIKSIISYDDDRLPYMEILLGDRNES